MCQKRKHYGRQWAQWWRAWGGFGTRLSGVEASEALRAEAFAPEDWSVIRINVLRLHAYICFDSSCFRVRVRDV